jgi:predicted PurR-regulated permease PerM
VNLGSQIAEEASNFFSRLPALLQAGQLQSIPLPSWMEPLRDRILEAVQHEATALQASIVPLLRRAGGQILTGINFIVLIVLVPILSFFLLKDAREINRFLIDTLTEAGDGQLIRRILDDIHLLLSKYIRALVLLAAVSFAAWSAFLYAIQAAYPLLLAGISGALEFIPVIGPGVALVVVVAASGISGSASSIIWIVVFWIAFRLFQDYVVNPLLMSAGVQLHPLLILLAILAGGQIGGIPGLFFSVPVIAILKVLFIRLREAQLHRALQHQQPT